MSAATAPSASVASASPTTRPRSRPRSAEVGPSAAGAQPRMTRPQVAGSQAARIGKAPEGAASARRETRAWSGIAPKRCARTSAIPASTRPAAPAAAGTPPAAAGTIPAATRPMTRLVVAPRSSRARARTRDGAAGLPSASALATIVAAAAASRLGDVPARPRARPMPAAPPRSAPGADGCHVARRATTRTRSPPPRERARTRRRWSLPASAPPPMVIGASGRMRQAAASATTTAPMPTSVPSRRLSRRTVAITAPRIAATRNGSTLIEARRRRGVRPPGDRACRPG